MRKKLFLFIILITMFFIPNVYAKDEKYTIVSGNLYTINSEICFDDDCFYVIANDGNSLRLLAKHNITHEDKPVQSITAEGISFTDEPYWGETERQDAKYVYNSNSNLYKYVEAYKKFIIEKGVVVENARLVNQEELYLCGVDVVTYTWPSSLLKCESTFWSGVAYNNEQIWTSDLEQYGYKSSSPGIRPVLEIPVDWFNEENAVYMGGTKFIKASNGVTSNNVASIDLTFNDLGQYAKFETIIYNKTDEIMYINDVNVEGLSESYVNVVLDNNSKNKQIEAGGASLVSFYVKTLSEEGAGRNLDDEVTLNFMISDSVINPPTYSNIFEVLILFSILSLSIYFISKNKYKKVYSLILVIVLFIGGMKYVEANDFISMKLVGKIKYNSQNIIETTGTVLNGKQANYTNSKDVWAYYDKIKSVSVESLIDKPKDYYKKFDLSENDTDRVIGYLIENNDKDTPYDLVIMSNGVVIANKDSSFLFSFPNVEKIEGLSNVDFRSVTTMQGMFIGNKKLEKVEVESIELNNTTNTSYMFYDCDKIEHTKSDFNLSNVSNTTLMFIPYLYNEIKTNAKDDSNLNYNSSSGNGKYYINSTINDEFPIYFYRGSVRNNNNNVVFAGFCWKIVRTTETGGIKLLYNGVPAADGKCNNTGESSIVGKTDLTSMSSFIHNGSYMYGNSTALVLSDGGSFSENFIHKKSVSSNTSYYYSKNVVYSDGKYVLDDPKLYSYSEIYNELGGYYTYFSTSPTSSNKYVNYVFFADSSTVYFDQLYKGNLGNFNQSFYKSYEVNEDGTFKLLDPVTISIIDYYNGKYTDYVGYYLCSGSDNVDACERLLHIYGTSSTGAQCYGGSNFVYGKKYKYENGEYTLLDTKQIIHGIGNDYTSIYDYNYTCMSRSEKCSYLYHVVQTIPSTFYYIILSNGESVEQKMSSLYANNNNSLIKTVVDNWYYNNMRNYSHMLEDTVWYNDRTFTDGKLAGLSNKGNTTNKFSTYHRLYTLKQAPSFEYTNKDDMFTVNTANGNGKLTYPVGLITSDELALVVGGPLKYNSGNYLKIGIEWWTLSPGYVSGTTFYTGYVNAKGYLSFGTGYNEYGVRPMISLKHNVEYSSGTGSSSMPYIIE